MSKSESTNRKGKGGRKPKFDYTSEDFLSLVESYAKKGFTDKEIAYAIGILPQTFCEKKSEYTEISEVLARGRATINATVRAKFLAMALGGIKTKSTVVRKLRDTEGNLTGEEELQVNESELAPNLQAMSVWLYHHDEDWRKIERKQDEDADIPTDIEHGINIDSWIQEIYHPLYEDKEKFIILITGGRGSGKSFNASTFIERLTFEMTPVEKIVHQILYTRYTMVSAGMSIIPEMMEKIDLDGTTKYFKTTKTDIVNKMTKSRIMFRGIKTSSGNQTAKLKSIQGITTFVCDEAEEWMNEEEFDKIMLSIRKKGIQNRIIIIMNPCDSNHFIYKKYIEKTHKLVDIDGVEVQVSTHPNVLHIHTTYLDNLENLSPEFLKEVEDMKANNPEKYAHVVIGRWADVAEGAVFKKWGIVDEFPAWAKKVAIGQDFGYTHDPSASIRCGIVGNALYLDEVDYRTGLLSSDIIKTLRPWGLKVIADSADPRLIQEIHNGGIKIYAVEKGAGSISAGIDKMQDMEIYITKHSYNLQSEFRKYVWAKDKDGKYINEPEDHDNHGIDAARYYVLGELLGKIQKPKDLTGIFTH